MGNIIIGIIFIIGGLSGKLVLIGTNSSGALVVVGIGLLIWGIVKASSGEPEVISTKPGQILNEELLKKPEVIAFLKCTLQSWRKGDLDKLGPTFINIAKTTSYDDFTKIKGPFKGSALEKFFSIYKPLADEFLIANGENETGKDRGWFVLTNYNLIIKDGVSLAYQTIKLAEIESFKLTDDISTPCVFKLKSGSSLEINKVEIHPSEEYLQFAINLNK